MKTILLITASIFCLNSYSQEVNPQEYKKCISSKTLRLPYEFQGTFISEDGEILKIDRGGVVHYSDAEGYFGWVDSVRKGEFSNYEVESSCFKQSIETYAQSKVIKMQIKTSYNYLDRHKNYYETSGSKKSYINIRYNKSESFNNDEYESITLSTCHSLAKNFLSSVIETFSTGSSSLGNHGCKIDSWGDVYNSDVIPYYSGIHSSQYESRFFKKIEE